MVSLNLEKSDGIQGCSEPEPRSVLAFFVIRNNPQSQRVFNILQYAFSGQLLLRELLGVTLSYDELTDRFHPVIKTECQRYTVSCLK